jgi:hypothetical protein
MTRAQLNLFAEPPADTRRQRREQRQQRGAHRQAVALWAEDVLLRELAIQYAVEAGNELRVIAIDSSGPAPSWRSHMLRALQLEVPDGTKLPSTDVELVRLAVRIGRLPRSIWESMP